MLLIRLPGIEEADEIGERVFPSMPALVLLRHARQSGGVASKLPQRHPANITAPLQLSNILRNGIIET